MSFRLSGSDLDVGFAAIASDGLSLGSSGSRDSDDGCDDLVVACGYQSWWLCYWATAWLTNMVVSIVGSGVGLRSDVN